MQELQATPGRFYTAKELGDRWGKRAVTVRVWLVRMRRAGLAPRGDQVERKQLNAARRIVRYRADFALLIEEVFITKTRRLPKG